MGFATGNRIVPYAFQAIAFALKNAPRHFSDFTIRHACAGADIKNVRSARHPRHVKCGAHDTDNERDGNIVANKLPFTSQLCGYRSVWMFPGVAN
jgi:hypothetical protein